MLSLRLRLRDSLAHPAPGRGARARSAPASRPPGPSPPPPPPPRGGVPGLGRPRPPAGRGPPVAPPGGARGPRLGRWLGLLGLKTLVHHGSFGWFDLLEVLIGPKELGFVIHHVLETVGVR